MDPDERKRRRVRRLQKYLLNPPTKCAVHLGLVPGHIVLETTGRTTKLARRTVVGAHEDGNGLWVVAEQGRHAAYVRNLEQDPRVRVRLHGRWRGGRAAVVVDDDPSQRLATFGRERHARLVQSMGTSLLTVRIDLDAS